MGACGELGAETMARWYVLALTRLTILVMQITKQSMLLTMSQAASRPAVGC